MTSLSVRDGCVLILSREMIEAADIAEFATAHDLGEVIVLRTAERAWAVSKEKRVSYAFIGLPSSERHDGLLDTLVQSQTHIILVGADTTASEPARQVRTLSRPFTERDLEDATANK